VKRDYCYPPAFFAAIAVSHGGYKILNDIGRDETYETITIASWRKSNF
jgi:hypothetical protein